MGKNKHKNHAQPKQQSQGPIENAMPKEMQDAEELKNAIDLMMKNGFGDALGYPSNQSTPWSEQISQSTSLFKNLRWYFVSNMRQLLCELYVEIGLVSTIVDVPVDDALRGGIRIKSKQLDEDQILELVTSMDRDNDLMNVGQAEKWNRLFGGAGILIMTDQDPMTPLDLEAIKPDSALEFRAVDMWELFWDKQNTEGYDPEIQTQNFEFYNYYAKQIHKSRVIRLKGLTAPSFLRPRLRGWGFSVVERLVRSINQYLKATDLGYEVLDEFKLDIYKFKNLTNTLLSPIGSQKVKERVQMTNWQKNYQNAVVLDSEDDFDHKQLSFSGLAEAMEGIRMQVASDMRFPITKLFGTSASKGFATDQNDMEVYNSMVESEVRNKIKYSILRVLEIRCQQRFGFIPDDISIEFNPLRTLTAVEEETVKTGKFNRLMMAKQAGELTTFEFREAVNKDNLLGITLDNAGEELNPLDPDIARLVAGDPSPYHTTDVDDPGANREDTRKPRAWDTETGETQEMSTTRFPNDSDERIEKVEKEEKIKMPKDKIVKEVAPKLPKIITKNELNAIVVNIKPFTLSEKVIRRATNSIAFDRASFEAEGFEENWPAGREILFENPGDVDEALWAKAKEASQKAFGKIKYPFVVWWYKKQGGKFKAKGE